MNVGEFRRGGTVSPRRGEPLVPRQPMLTAEQIAALGLSIGALTGIAGSVDDAPLSRTLNRAAVTLQEMLTADTEAKAR